MRCHSCRRFSLSLICRSCRELYLNPEPRIRKLATGLAVLSFYGYDEIEPFLLTKHLPHGWFIYRILAAEAFKTLNNKREEGVCAIPVDDNASGGYSHTAILANRLRYKGYHPLVGMLHARNRISYAGQPLAFRLQNPREFNYRGPDNIEAVLLDDIVTSGLTLQEAHGVLLRAGVTVRSAIVLADVDR
ncbi:ComF family protein [Hydrogenimonas sp.]|uniref:ComF family protein n=1 Tax=Hydrogenimonas sp. TaxID=2231112 RepID=UPI00261CBDC0|nr:ComF family protein [Hydrogenimonas sp.]